MYVTICQFLKGEPSNQNPPEGRPSPLSSQGSAQEVHKIPQGHQVDETEGPKIYLIKPIYFFSLG